MHKISPVYFERASRVFSAHVGQSEPLDGYGCTPWRNWLITGLFGIWFVVPKARPTSRPRAYLCSLAQTKANLLAGY